MYSTLYSKNNNNNNMLYEIKKKTNALRIRIVVNNII